MVTLDMSFNNKIGFQDLKLNYNFKVTIGSYIKYSYNSYLTLKKLKNMSLSLHYTLEDAIVSKILRVIPQFCYLFGKSRW